MYGSTIASDLVCLAGLVSELNAVPGLLDNLPSGRPGTAPEMGGESGNFSVQHAVGNANQAQSVLDGINPKYFNPESRFGWGFYVGTDADTIVAELSEHGNIAKYAISYDMNLSGQK